MLDRIIVMNLYLHFSVNCILMCSLKSLLLRETSVFKMVVK